MPAGPPGWIHRMHQECGCEFVLAVQGLAPVEVGSGVWIGPMLPGCIEGVAPFHLHLRGGGLGGGGVWWCLPLAGGEVGDDRGSGAWKGELHEGFQ